LPPLVFYKLGEGEKRRGGQGKGGKRKEGKGREIASSYI